MKKGESERQGLFEEIIEEVKKLFHLLDDERDKKEQKENTLNQLTIKIKLIY